MPGLLLIAPPYNPTQQSDWVSTFQHRNSSDWQSLHWCCKTTALPSLVWHIPACSPSLIISLVLGKNSSSPICKEEVWNLRSVLHLEPPFRLCWSGRTITGTLLHSCVTSKPALLTLTPAMVGQLKARLSDPGNPHDDVRAFVYCNRSKFTALGLIRFDGHMDEHGLPIVGAGVDYTKVCSPLLSC